MKRNYGNKKENGALYKQSLISGRDFVSLRLEAVKRDLIAPTDTADRRYYARNDKSSLKKVEIDFLETAANFVAAKPTIEVLSNSAESAMSSTVTLDGHHLNPLQQAKDASRRVVEYRHAAHSMEGLFNVAKKQNLKNYTYEGDRLYAYAGVLSFTNAHKGNLKTEVKALNDKASAFWKKLKDAHNRDGLTNRLTAANGDGYAAPVGMLMANEMTINTDKLLAMDKKGIYHPHIHFILFTDKPLADSVTADLYQIWDDLTGTRYTVPNAFTFAKVYSKSATIDESSAILDSLKEVTKYLMDPSKMNIFSLKKTDSVALRDFKVELFAEYFNAYSGMKRMRSYGLLRDAQGFINRFSDFENASIFKTSDILGNLLTQLNELKYDIKKQRYNFNHIRVLTSDEILHENNSYLSRVLVSEDYKKDLDDFVDIVIGELKTDKDILFAEYCKNKQYHSTARDMMDMFDKEFADIDRRKKRMTGILFDADTFKATYGFDFELGNYDHFVLYRDSARSLGSVLRSMDVDEAAEDADKLDQFVELFGKACDIKLLKTAFEKLLSTDESRAVYSRTDIDQRIFDQRREYRAAGISVSMDIANLFFQKNGMTLPIDARTHETIDLFAKEKSFEELCDLFRVPDGARKQVDKIFNGIMIGGEAA